MSELDVSYSVLLGKTRAALFRPWGDGHSASVSHGPDGFLAFQPGSSG